MKWTRFTFVSFLFILLTININAQSLTSKSKDELIILKQEAIAKEDYLLAGKIKAQLERMEEHKESINQLEKEKEAALTIEDYDKVIAIEKQIEALKTGKKYEPETSKQINETPKVLPPKPAKPVAAPKKKRSAMQRYFKPRANGT